jgi:hypothetical protein
MKPIRNKVLVRVDMSQKSGYEIVTPGGLKLYMNSDFGFNGHNTNPNLATVVEPNGMPGLEVGDTVVCMYNTFRMEVANGYLLGDTGVDDGGRIFAISPDLIQLKIVDGVPRAVGEYMIVETIEAVPDTFLFVPDSVVKVHDNMFRVVDPGVNDMGIVEGDTIVTYNKSGIPVIFNAGGTKIEITRVRHGDILAVMERV